MKEHDRLYNHLIKPIDNQMIGIIRRVIRDPEDARDVFQIVLERIWSNLERIDQHPNPHAYILRICVTCAYDALRKRSRRIRFETLHENIKSVFLPDPPDNPLEECDPESALYAAIAMLPQKQGKAVILRSIQDLSYELIGNILGCSESTARSHFSKGKTRLGQILTEMGISL